MILSIIVAATENDVIGKEGGMPWYLPAELARFKEVTMGHPIIMGRKTHESIGRALPGRENIVVTRNPKYRAADGCVVVDSLEKALTLKEVKTAKEAFIIGGAEIYQQALPKAQRLYLTRVHAKLDGDKFFKFKKEDWREIERTKMTADDKNPYNYDFLVLERLTKT